jgi:hypothetical protein
VFLVYDDFPGSTINATTWNNQLVSVGSGVATFGATAGAEAYINNLVDLPNNVKLKAYYTADSANHYAGIFANTWADYGQEIHNGAAHITRTVVSGSNTDNSITALSGYASHEMLLSAGSKLTFIRDGSVLNGRRILTWYPPMAAISVPVRITRSFWPRSNRRVMRSSGY